MTATPEAPNSRPRKMHRMPMAVLCVCGGWLWKSSKEKTAGGVLADNGHMTCRNTNCPKYGLLLRVPSVEVEEVGVHQFVK